MVKETILLDSIEKVESLVKLANSKKYDVDISSGKYLVNAKSIMGVFSLDLTLPVTVVAEDGDRFLTEQLKKI